MDRQGRLNRGYLFLLLGLACIGLLAGEGTYVALGEQWQIPLLITAVLLFVLGLFRMTRA